MPSFVNVGARVGRNTMVDTWATVGSCAQIGDNCHLSGGVGIGGVLEPLQANPVIIEDDCFVGARSEVAEGVVVERGSVLSMGVFIGASTKIIDRATGEIFIGRVPAYSVVVPGSLPGKPLPDGSPGSVAILCGHREDRGCADAGKNIHQRAVARLMAAEGPAAGLSDPLPLAQALIRCASVTPADAGAQTALSDSARPAGIYVIHRLRYGEIEKYLPGCGTERPQILLRRAYRRRAGGRGELAQRSVRR